MYCKKCGKQLREGAVFCGNCGSPISVQNKKAIAAIGGNSGKTMNTVAQKTTEAERSRKKKGEKKTFGILLLSMLLLLVVGAGGCFWGYKLNEDKQKVVETMEELEQEPEQTDKRDEKEKEQGTEEKGDVEIQQEDGKAVTDAPKPESQELEKEILRITEEETQKEEKRDETGIHTYELIVEDVTWSQAYQNCIDKGGYLVRINSDEEYLAILQQIVDEDKRKIKFWLGGARSSEESEDYRWVYEDGTYGDIILNEEEPCRSYWLSGEPSYSGGEDDVEMYMNMFYVSKEGRWVWNDVADDLIAVASFYAGTVGYICEYE